MQAVLTNTIKLIKNTSELKFPKEVIPYLLGAVENCDAKTRNEIENRLVQMGDIAVSDLIINLKSATGAIRGLIAMVLIRLGASSIDPLRDACIDTPDLLWMAEYIINEIEGSKMPLGQSYRELSTVLAG
jgi:hypothetical protein